MKGKKWSKRCGKGRLAKKQYVKVLLSDQVKKQYFLSLSQSSDDTLRNLCCDILLHHPDDNKTHAVLFPTEKEIKLSEDIYERMLLLVLPPHPLG